MSAILMKTQSWLAPKWSRLSGWWTAERWPMRLYASGVFAIAVSIFLLLAGITYNQWHKTVFIFGGVLLAAGIILEAYELVIKWVATGAGKLIAALLATMIAALSMGIASVIINEATGFPPSEFPYTTAFIAPLTAGYLLVLAGAFFFIASLFVGLAGMFVSIVKSIAQQGFSAFDSTYQAESIRMLARIVAAIALFTIVNGMWRQHHTSYESSLKSWAGRFAYVFEMYRNDPCVREKGEHVRHMDTDKVLVGFDREGKLAFFTRRCEPKIFE